MNPTRLYYQVRNLSYIKDKYKFFKAWLIIKMKYFKVILLFNNKRDFLKAYKKALMAEKSNRFGKVDKINGK